MSETLKLVPDGFPPFLAFKANSDTIELHTALAQHLELVERKLNTSNHLQAHQAMQQMVLPAVLALYQWASASQRDILEHMHDLAVYMNEAAVENEALDLDYPSLITFLGEVAERLGAVDDTEYAEAAKGWATQIAEAFEASTEEVDEEDEDLFTDDAEKEEVPA